MLVIRRSVTVRSELRQFSRHSLVINMSCFSPQCGVWWVSIWVIFAAAWFVTLCCCISFSFTRWTSVVVVVADFIITTKCGQWERKGAWYVHICACMISTLVCVWTILMSVVIFLQHYIAARYVRFAIFLFVLQHCLGHVVQRKYFFNYFLKHILLVGLLCYFWK